MILHHTPEPAALPAGVKFDKSLVVPTMQRREDWQSLNHFQLTYIEQVVGKLECPVDFIPVATLEECEAAAYHLRREFIPRAEKNDRPVCTLYGEHLPPTIAYGNLRHRPAGIKGRPQTVCHKMSPPAASKAFIGMQRIKHNEVWSKMNREKALTTTKAPKIKTTKSDGANVKKPDKKWDLLEYAEGSHNPKFEYMGPGWCTNGQGRRIKLRKTHWMTHPGHTDFSVEFCENLCLIEGAPICAGYVINISFGRTIGFQCDIINALDGEYGDGIQGIFPDEVSERHCWRLVDYPKFKSREDAILAAPPRPEPNPLAEGIILAKHFNSHCIHLWPPKHWTDSIASSERGTLYVTNVKSGSMSIRQKFFILRAGFFTSPLPIANEDAKYQCGRHSTGVWESSDIYDAGLTIFSWVRDPVKKFESGVRQAWFHDGSLANITADDMLDMVLGDGTIPRTNIPKKNCGKSHNLEYNWINEHLQPSTWRLTGETNDRKHLQFSFIGKLEHMNRDWNELLTRIHVDKEEEYLLPLLEEKMWVKNAREKDPKSILSKKAIRKMCKSERYRREWACFNYDPPPECADLDMSLGN